MPDVMFRHLSAALQKMVYANKRRSFNIKYAVFQNDIIQNAIVMGTPVSGFFELTSRCNFRCKMCYVCEMGDQKKLAEKELTADQWLDLGRQAMKAGVLFLTLTGGEIFIRKDFWQIYEGLSQMGFLITLYTNGSLLSDEMIQRLAKLPPFKISITIYGASPSTYEKITERLDGYDKTISNIQKLIEAGIKVELKTTVVKYNTGEFEQLARLARSMGQNIGIVNYISPRREGAGTDPLANRLDPYDLAVYELNANRTMKQLYDKNKDKETQGLIVDDVMASEHLDNLMDLSSVQETAFKCSAGKCAFWQAWDGRLLPCGLLTDISADSLTLGFEGAWKQLQKKCREVPHCQECESCSKQSECMVCPARRKLETGSYSKAAPYICAYVKARNEVNPSFLSFT